MKPIAILLCIALALLPALTGCRAQKDYDVTELAEALLAEAAFDETPEELSRDVLGWRYGLADDVEARVFVASGTSEELCVVKAADEDGARAILDLLGTHLEDMKDAYANYAPAEVTRLEHAQLRRAGCVVVLLVSADERPGELLDRYL